MARYRPSINISDASYTGVVLINNDIMSVSNATAITEHNNMINGVLAS